MARKSRRQNFQPIAWFWDLYTRKVLDLNPPYQRRSVWNQSYKNAFIDTILSQFPAPALFLYEEISPAGQSLYHVVDGKQRLTSIFEFASGEFPVSDTAHALHLRGKYFEHLSDDDKTDFWTYVFSVEYLPTNDESLINQIFERINRNTAKLSRQELRHAQFDGKFINVAEELAEWLLKKLPEGFPRFESQSKKQMKDVELVANLLLFLEEGANSYSQDELDLAFSKRDEGWEKADEIQDLFRKTVDAIAGIVSLPPQAPLFKSRLRNQADFYSLFGSASKRVNDLRSDAEYATASTKLVNFIGRVEAPAPTDIDANDYYSAARSNSNDIGPRKKRIEILDRVLQ